MASHIIKWGTFFTDSPGIRIRRSKAINQLVQDVVDEEQRNPEKGLGMNCFTRPSSDEERDGHLARVQGMQRMNDFLRNVEALGKKAQLLYHTKKGLTWNVNGDHPCKMLATSDKRFMSESDKKHLSRCKVENMMKTSARPTQLVGDYMFAGQFCLYCNGDYDDKIEVALGRRTDARTTADCAWTDGKGTGSLAE